MMRTIMRGVCYIILTTGLCRPGRGDASGDEGETQFLSISVMIFEKAVRLGRWRDGRHGSLRTQYRIRALSNLGLSRSDLWGLEGEGGCFPGCPVRYP